jgi:hypothetical protein
MEVPIAIIVAGFLFYFIGKTTGHNQYYKEISYGIQNLTDEKAGEFVRRWLCSKRD